MEFGVVPHDAPDGGIHYVISGKGDDFPMSDGLGGGYPGAPNGYIWVRQNSEAEETKLPHSRFPLSLADIPGEQEAVGWGVFPLMGEDALYIRWNGGGGYGDPVERDPQAVLDDLSAGVISGGSAEKIYGVALDNGGSSIDLKGTEERRRSILAARLVQEAAE